MNIQNLKNARQNMGFTQKEVAEKIGVGQSTYTNYETGLREPNGDTIVELAKVLKTSTDYLLGKEDAPKPYYHEELEDDLKEVYRSLPKDVRAKILQAIIDTVHKYEQRAGTVVANPAAEEAAAPDPPQDAPEIASEKLYPVDKAARSAKRGESSPITTEYLTAEQIADTINAEDADPKM